MSNRLREIEALGQSIWIDNISRQLLEDGIMARLVEEDGISGVTSNPTIFEKAMAHSDRYDDAFRETLDETNDPQEIFERLAYRDIRDAADLLRPTFDRTEGQDGYVSFEVPASLAFDADKTIEAAQRYKAEIDRPNVLIKVPGTGDGVRAFEELTALGVNVNVTLLFAVERYEAIAEAFLKGLERRVKRGESIDKSSLRGELLRLARGHQGGQGARGHRPRGPAREGRGGQRQDRLRVVPAHLQRAALGGAGRQGRARPASAVGLDLDQEPRLLRHPVRRRADRPGHGQHDARPDHRGRARPRHGKADGRPGLSPRRTQVIDEVKAAGVDFDRIVMQELVDEGVKSFGDSYDSLLESIKDKAAQLVHAG